MIPKETSALKINGLVLAGGRSVRMGTAKEEIRWHGEEQRYFAADLLRGFCKDVFISCRQEQLNGMKKDYATLVDAFMDIGPMGGVLSAFSAHPDRAWLVVACDLPLLHHDTLRLLIEGRDVEKNATAFESPFNKQPEPLITIWEPTSYPILLKFFNQHIFSLTTVLANADVKILEHVDANELMNVNTPEEAATARELLARKNNPGA